MSAAIAAYRWRMGRGKRQALIMRSHDAAPTVDNVFELADEVERLLRMTELEQIPRSDAEAVIRRRNEGIEIDGQLYPHDGRCEFGWVSSLLGRGERCRRSAVVGEHFCTRHDLRSAALSLRARPPYRS